MKKINKWGVLAFINLISLTSCNESETFYNANQSSDRIVFNPTLDHTWKSLTPGSNRAATSRANEASKEERPITVSTSFGKTLYLHTVAQDGIHIWNRNEGTLTRGAMKDDMADYGSFGVSAIYKEDGIYTSLVSNAQTAFTGTDWELKDSKSAYWPYQSQVSFHAYAPYSDGANTSGDMIHVENSAEDIKNVRTRISYTASATDIGLQPDLIIASAAEIRTLGNRHTPVNLDFKHALTAVTFALGSDLTTIIGDGTKLKRISLSGIPNKGEISLVAKDEAHTNYDGAIQWTVNPDQTASYTFDLSQIPVVAGNPLALTSGNRTLMMIPQTLPDGAQLKLEFSLHDEPQSLIVDLKGLQWLPGTSVIYKLSANAINTLEATKVEYPVIWNATGYPKKSFSLNDEIGIYAISRDHQLAATNVKLIRHQENGQEIWKTIDGRKFMCTSSYRYFAYYPYSSIAADVDVNATEASDFFKKKIDALPTVADQNDAQRLLAQDFQIANGVVAADASTMVFTMEHQVGLAVLNLKGTKTIHTRQYLNDSYKYFYGDLPTPPTTADYRDLDTYTITASKNFVGNKPYQVTAVKHLQIIPFGKRMEFHADDEAGTHHTYWGREAGKVWAAQPATAIPQELQITIDKVPDFYYMGRRYAYTGQVLTFQAPTTGLYKLECWGARGGDTYYYRGGGYAMGGYLMQKGDEVYFCTGGNGLAPNGMKGGAGGYNGGGDGGDGAPASDHTFGSGGCGGGGASHIALEKGLLRDLKDCYNRGNLLLVAGGAGGGDGSFMGYGGGTEGGHATTVTGAIYGKTASQDLTSGYQFGQGQHGMSKTTKATDGSNGTGGGGGGFMGGLSPQLTGENSDGYGGGGSGFVNTQKLVSFGGIEPNTAPGTVPQMQSNGTLGNPQGNGVVSITWFPPQKK